MYAVQTHTQQDRSQTYRRGRTLGVIVRTETRDRGYVFIKDGTNVEYFAHKSAFVAGGFDGVEAGDPVSFRVTETTKGLRAFDIVRATEEERAQINAQEENRGNR